MAGSITQWWDQSLVQWWETSASPRAMIDFLRKDPEEHVISFSDRQARLYACNCCLLRGTPTKTVDEYEIEGPPDHDLDDGHTDQSWARGWTEYSRHGNPKPPLKVRCDIIRDLVENPFDSPVEGRAHLTDVVSKYVVRSIRLRDVARLIYTRREFAELPILADMLEEAGGDCYSKVLDHLRGPGPHFRGCWALELILGRM